MNIEISEVLASMRRSLLTDPVGDLPLGLRLQLWARMKRQFGKDAKYRRNALAYLSTRMAVKSWASDGIDFRRDPAASAFAFHLPPLFFAAVHWWLGEGRPYREIEQLGRHVIGLCEHVPALVRDFRMTAMYPLMHSLLIRFGGEDDAFYEKKGWYRLAQERPLEMRDNAGAEFWTESGDPYYWAASVAAFTDEDHVYEPAQENFEKRRAFWLDWIDTKIPLVFQSLEELKQVFLRDHAPLLEPTSGTGRDRQTQPRQKTGKDQNWERR